ncbi:hypothetical protein ElyMa_001332000 [Elysia marginata]|uniref:Apple domain-containing protein n=1 Tax=Elysia marginata TaxID=1093978 RepID=A0AAV4IJW6_9GAST|nr:hypothetical protein ElyMa_001332000 [Elysia marginata]
MFYRVTDHDSVYIGMQYQPEEGALVWDDGTRPRPDTPFYGRPADSSYRYARLTLDGRIMVGEGSEQKSALCGNHKNAASESWGRTVQGELMITNIKVLDQRKLFSYPECALLCGMTLDCRVAEFNFDFLTCTLVGENKVIMIVPNPNIINYIRQMF